MNADQVIEGIGKAVAATKPAQEYCFLWIDWWPMCMTKSEWAAWGQVFAVTVTLFLPYAHLLHKRHKAKQIVRSTAEDLQFNVVKLRSIARAALETEKSNAQAVFTDVLARFDYFREPLPIQIDAFNVVSSLMAVRLITAIGAIKSRKSIIKQLESRGDILEREHLYLHLHWQGEQLNEEIDELEKVAHWAKAT